MDFYKVVDDVLALLRGRGRVTYRALKVQFQLDDEQVEALKEEVIYAKKLAVDEETRVLVWVGEQATTSHQTPQPPTDEPPPIEPRPREAERRQLTVMFCDLVDSTKLSSQLDPEDYREVIRAYQATCTEVIQRYDGHIAQYLGDGLLVYFGYPQSHEDEAQRAVYTGLGLLNTLKQLNAPLEQDKGIRLALRIGIHTGLVVVGDIGEGSRQEQLALGELIDQIPTASIYTLVTCRPTFQPSWSHRSYLTEITVNRLSRQQIARVVEHVAGGKNLPEQVFDQIVEKTDGVPLFVEELTRAILESGHLKEVDGPGPFSFWIGVANPPQNELKGFVPCGLA